MSIFSDHDVGALSDEEYERECIRMNNQDRWEREHFLSNEYEDIEREEWNAESEDKE